MGTRYGKNALDNQVNMVELNEINTKACMKTATYVSFYKKK